MFDWRTIHQQLQPDRERSPEGQEFPNRSVYLDVVKNERLVFTDVFVKRRARENGFRKGDQARETVSEALGLIKNMG